MGREVRCVGGWLSEVYELHRRDDRDDDDDGSGIGIDGGHGKSHKHTQTQHNEKEQWAVVFVPGNPGVLGFYYEFLTAIYEHFNASVCIWLDELSDLCV